METSTQRLTFDYSSSMAASSCGHRFRRCFRKRAKRKSQGLRKPGQDARRDRGPRKDNGGRRIPPQETPGQTPGPGEVRGRRPRLFRKENSGAGHKWPAAAARQGTAIANMQKSITLPKDSSEKVPSAGGPTARGLVTAKLFSTTMWSFRGRLPIRKPTPPPPPLAGPGGLSPSGPPPGPRTARGPWAAQFLSRRARRKA